MQHPTRTGGRIGWRRARLVSLRDTGCAHTAVTSCAGHDGGTVVFAGPPAQLVDHPTSVTARFLRQRINA